jgi:hypothetical protein
MAGRYRREDREMVRQLYVTTDGKDLGHFRYFTPGEARTEDDHARITTGGAWRWRLVTVEDLTFDDGR